MLAPIIFFTYFSWILLNFLLFRAALAAMEVPRPGVKSELQLLACATATAMRDPSHVCDLHHNSQQCRIPNPLSKARGQTSILMDTSWVFNPLIHNTYFSNTLSFTFAVSFVMYVIYLV